MLSDVVRPPPEPRRGPSSDDPRDASPYDEAYYRQTYGHDLSRRLPRLTREHYWARWLRRHVADRHARIVDLGSGLGWFALSARARGLAPCSLDISEFSATRLRAQHGLPVAVASASHLPVRTASLAGIVALDVLEHVPEPQRALADLRRALQPGGVLVASVPNMEGFGARHKRRSGSWFADHDPTHVSLLQPDRWSELFVQSGFAIERRGSDTLWDVPYPGPIPARVQRAALLPLHRAISWSFGSLPWSQGENLVLVGRAA
ncbi:MAG TPA: class I SAM-dependent methyltransferase [Acidimicrobiia bacterium]